MSILEEYEELAKEYRKLWYSANDVVEMIDFLDPKMTLRQCRRLEVLRAKIDNNYRASQVVGEELIPPEGGKFFRVDGLRT